MVVVERVGVAQSAGFPDNSAELRPLAELLIDDGAVVGDGIAAGLGMLWAAIAASPWTMVLFVAIIVGALWLQLTSTRRRRRQ